MTARTDIINSVGFADQTFQLQSRQELSRTAGGTTYGKDLGPALWTSSYTTGPLTADVALRFEAKLNSLNGVAGTFEAGDLRRPYPQQYPTGDFGDTGTINSVTGTKISLKNLDAGMLLSVGDYLAFDNAGQRMLHQIMEDVTANGSGTTAEFEVRPAPLQGTVADIAVKLDHPCGYFALLPGSVTTRLQNGMHTVISFDAGQII